MRKFLALLTFWGCSCGIHGQLPLWAQFWVANQANAATAPYQEYANALCTGLRSAYGAPAHGWKVVFKACRPANYDKVAGEEFYWVWYKVLHAGRVALLIVKVDVAGNPVEGPYKLSPSEYDHVWRPGTSDKLSA